MKGLKEMKALCRYLGEKIHQAVGKANEVGAGVGRLPGMFKKQPSGKEQKE